MLADLSKSFRRTFEQHIKGTYWYLFGVLLALLTEKQIHFWKCLNKNEYRIKGIFSLCLQMWLDGEKNWKKKLPSNQKQVDPLSPMLALFPHISGIFCAYRRRKSVLFFLIKI
jgi:hypothetical protein